MSLQVASAPSKIFSPPLLERQPFALGFIEAAVAKGRLAHALLFSGQAISDKWDAARQLACFLNCTCKAGSLGRDSFESELFSCLVGGAHRDPTESGKAEPGLGQTTSLCQNTRWILEGKHPQAWLTLTTEGSKGGKISVEKVRQLLEELSKTSAYTRVVVIEDGDREVFHRASANALLKTIENPGQACLFLIFAESQKDVLATVVSRCQVVPFKSTEAKPSAVGRLLSGETIASQASHSREGEIQVLKQALTKLGEGGDDRAMIYWLDLSRTMQDLLGDNLSPDEVIDMTVNLELERLGQGLIEDDGKVKYLNNLLKLAENAKLQISHYVTAKAAIESFALSWWHEARSVRP